MPAIIPSPVANLEFKNYRKEKPLREGWYIWRAKQPNADAVVIFLSEYKKRGQIYETAPLPSFAKWDLQRHILPNVKIEWAEYDGATPHRSKEVIAIDGLQLNTCPVCRKEPRWTYGSQFSDSGPLYTGYWYIECCDWINGFNHRSHDPKDVAKKWNEATADKIV